MVLESQWYAIIIYWFPLRDLIRKPPQSSDYSLLMRSSKTWSSLVGAPSSMVTLSFWADVSILFSRGLGGLIDGGLGSLVFVERTPWQLCVVWPLMVSLESEKYLVALA